MVAFSETALHRYYTPLLRTGMLLTIKIQLAAQWDAELGVAAADGCSVDISKWLTAYACVLVESV
jgi:hypothetical protein